jgi:hypothetical protein
MIYTTLIVRVCFIYFKNCRDDSKNMHSDWQIIRQYKFLRAI